MLPSGFLLEGGRRMITVFNRETIYIGNDMGRFSQIRDILSRAGIDYTYKVSNPLNRALGTSGGETVRSMTGGSDSAVLLRQIYMKCSSVRRIMKGRNTF